MKISRLKIENFRGIRSSELLFPDHVVLIGDNNIGKSTILEAMNLVLGPDRLRRRPPIDEHDFYLGRYLADDEAGASEGVDAETIESHTDTPEVDEDVQTDAAAETESTPAIGGEGGGESNVPKIRIETTVINLSDEQKARFINYIEWWDTKSDRLYTTPDVEGVDAEGIVAALRVAFIGEYVEEEDDFEGRTYFARSLEESDNPQPFSRHDKQHCGFLYLRGLRTGRRALSLERGSLLDIILRLKEIRPQMWEATISRLAEFDVASDPDLGISGILESINVALKKYVPKEWGDEPRLRVSALTRDDLRDVITAFISTGEGGHATPYYLQGAGTINMLVLAMLSQIAEDKQSVIFAMEEPEIAIPPYAQKRIVHEVRKLSSQSIFTSHSPYVIEEFGLDETVVLSRAGSGELSRAPVELPTSVKHKRYRREFRTRFCEGLLSRRVLIAEGATEASAFPAVARRLAELDPAKYSSLEALGICTIDAGGDTQIADLGRLYRSLHKNVYALCDEQHDAASVGHIQEHVDELFMHPEDGFEDLVLKNTTQKAIKRFADLVIGPLKGDVDAAVRAHLVKEKGSGAAADFLSQCTEDEIPQWLRGCCVRLRELAQAALGEVPAVEDGNEGEA